ncbi:hypothetical protein COT97_04400 [Candidatus Falkowbacteria bacterium CG10_big_fil_rev_8_21_14_0_10_39_11]|uniref:Class F sortase n=1 Tax=Candidatus Falkowbacteria bacterium CG10_big_fil_rev_8_21_14_0_10_39_11 TaxID=1974565 RepID=A0A2H0V494_9BACT|nr:MAG: hypothetical protein COT97_04400 [Candidatus Falkowbacteria bacterium CG10_big_fil_rev_8_21_14_0_10_39_11]
MRTKIMSKQELLLVVPLGLVFFIALFLNFSPEKSAQDSPVLVVEDVAAASNQEQTSLGLPARLKISAIGVDSVVVPVGLTSDGAMDVPKDPAEVAWYSLGSRPGEIGSAVIAGHYDWIKNIPAVFNDLDQLSQGDKIFVEDESGVTSTFIVRDIRIYDKDQDASDVFVSADDQSHLNLITCAGSWNMEEEIYSDRLIVFADKES